MESPPPRGPGPVVLATDVASLSVTIARTESRGPRAFPARREHSVLRALRVCLEARHPLRRGALTVAVVDLTPGKHSSEMDAFLAACARELGPGGGRDARRVVPCDADDADDAAFVACEAHLVAVFAREKNADADDDDDARRCPPRLLAALARARSGGAAIVAVGRAAIRAVGPGSGGADAGEAERQTTAEDDVKDARATGRGEEKAPPFLVPVVARVASAPSAERPKSSPAATARDWRRLTRELFSLSHRNGVCHVTRSGEAPFSLTTTGYKKNKVVGLGLVPGGCAACFADGSVEALVEDAVRFERADGFGVDPAKTPVSGSSPAVFRRVVLRASLALFGGGVSAVSAAEGTADGARLRPPAPPPRLIPTDTETLSRRHASCACLFDAETLVSAEWWPFWSGARAAAAAAVERAVRLLARPSVSRVVFFTGAGASAESGMPAFRETVPGAADVDADGVRVGPATPLDALLPIWKTHDPEKYSTLSAFREDPGACWFLHRRMFDQMRGLRPNDAHVAIETLAGAGVPNTRTETSANENASSLKETGFEVTVVTQNIDGLHQTAAAASRTSTRTIELHGSTRRVACLERCGWSEDAETFLRLWAPPATRATVQEKARTGAEEEEEGERHTDGKRKRRSEEVCFESSDGNGVVLGGSRSNKKKRTTRVPGAFPTCGGCGVAPAKPACVFFGEALPDAAVKAARAACARAHAVVIVGTSLSVFPAADLPRQARVHTPRAPIVRVDACASATSTVGPDDAVITRRAARAVPALVRRVLELRDGSRGYVAEDAEGAEGGIGRPVASAAPRMFS